MKNSELIQRIQERQVVLDRVKLELKQIFFGIDDQIDKILEDIKAWYVTPEIITRPLIINLWGLTGVGKTSLIRELVSRLNFNSKYVEIQMGGNSSSSYNYTSNICSILKQSGLMEKEPGILLLDEFQRYRTVDEEGKDVKDLKFQDVWMLLSDGKFAKDYSLYERIMDFIDYNLIDYNEDEDESNTPAKKDKKKKIEFKDKKLSRWQMRSLKMIMGSAVTAEELKDKTISEIDSMVREYMLNSAGESIDYSKLLIFVSGNLDEAYDVSFYVEDSDTDADIYHDLTKSITTASIKKALLKRFKPEQIARLGNNHVIYPSLNKRAYEKIIETSCNKLAVEAGIIGNINFTINPTVVDEIYNNSVYPSQGTRPVFSSIHKMFASPLTNGLFWALTNDIDTVAIDISAQDSAIVFTGSNKTVNFPIDFDIKKTKERYTKDFTAMIAVHESGHAIANCLLYKYAPKQIKINLASFKGGFNQISKKNANKESLQNNIATLLAGRIAEEIIFGPELCSVGSENDLMQATNTAQYMVRKIGFGETTSSYIMRVQENRFNEDVESTDAEIDKIIKTQRERVRNLLEKHKDILIECSKWLIEKKEILPDEFIEKFGDRLDVKKVGENSDYDIYGNYYEMLMSQ